MFEDITVKDYKISLVNTKSFYYIRIHSKELDNRVIKTITSKTNKEKQARSYGEQLLKEFDLEQLKRSFLERQELQKDKNISQKADKRKNSNVYSKIELAGMKAKDFFNAFWNEERSPYLVDRKISSKKFSKKYLKENLKYIDRFIMHKIIDEKQILETNPSGHLFDMLIGNIRSEDIYKFVLILSKHGKSYYTIQNCLKALRQPLTYAYDHGLITKEIHFRKLPIPPKADKIRGILTNDEVSKILMLPVKNYWITKEGIKRLDVRPRPRLPGNKKHEGKIEEVYLMEKTAVLMGLFIGGRKGEFRALQWKQIDFDNDIIDINFNFVDDEKELKQPKANSVRSRKIYPDLKPLLLELKNLAIETKTYDPDSFILCNPRNHLKPCGTNYINRSFYKILHTIGIYEEEIKRRNLVFHGTRHFVVKHLKDHNFSDAEIGQITGQRSTKVIKQYADHPSYDDSIQQRANEVLKLATGP